MKFCPAKKKNCNKNGYNLIQCWYANRTRKPKSKIRQAQSDEIVNRNLKKYVTVDIFNSSIKFQLDLGSDMSIITWRTWRKLNKPTLLKTDKTAKCVTGENINIFLSYQKAGSLRTKKKKKKKKFGQLVRNRLDIKFQSMGLPNEYILSPNRKYRFGKS